MRHAALLLGAGSVLAVASLTAPPGRVRRLDPPSRLRADGARRRARAWAATLPMVRDRRRRERDGQLAAWLERLASALRSGSSLPGAISATATSAPTPLRADLLEVERAISHGASLASALERWCRSPESSPATALTARALGLGLGSGGELARSVDRIAATLRDRSEAQAEVRALATQARASAGLLAVAPVGFTALLGSIEPGVVRFLVGTPLGWGCLVLGLGLEATGAVWMQRIVRGVA